MQQYLRPTGTLEDFFGSVIQSTTRERRLQCGDLVDVTETAMEAGLQIPVAITRNAYDLYVEWSFSDSREQDVYQDEARRLWYLLSMSRGAKIGPPGYEYHTEMEFYCVPRDGKTKFPLRLAFKVISGPDDQDDPVITILMPNEG